MATNFLTGQTQFLGNIDAAYQKAEQEARNYVDYLTQNNLLWQVANQTPPTQDRQIAEQKLKDSLYQTALAQAQEYYVQPEFSNLLGFIKESNVTPISPYSRAPNVTPTTQPPKEPLVNIQMSWFDNPSWQSQPAFQKGIQAYGSVANFKRALQDYNRAYDQYLVDFAEEQANLGLLGTARPGYLASTYAQAAQSKFLPQDVKDRYAAMVEPLEKEAEQMEESIAQYRALDNAAVETSRYLFNLRTQMHRASVEEAKKIRDLEYEEANKYDDPTLRSNVRKAADSKYDNFMDQAQYQFDVNTQFIKTIGNQIRAGQVSDINSISLPFTTSLQLPTLASLQDAQEAMQKAQQVTNVTPNAPTPVAPVPNIPEPPVQQTPTTPQVTTPQAQVPQVTPPLAETPVQVTPPLAAPVTPPVTPPLAATPPTTPVATQPTTPVTQPTTPVATQPTTPSITQPTTVPQGSFLGGIPVGVSAQPTQTGNLPMATALSTENLPPLRSSGGGGTSAIDPTLRPYLELGLRAAEQQFLQTQPQFFPGQTYVSPSQQTLDALAAQEQIARTAPSTLQAAQESYMRGLGGLGATAQGAFLGGNPFLQQAMQAAVRPIQQQFAETTLPGISSMFSGAGRYGSGAMERALGRATESTARALGDVGANLAYTDYASERARQQQAMGLQIEASQIAPQIYGQQFLPSQQLAQIGAAREAIAAQPLQEQMARFQFAQQAPTQQLQSFLSSVYGTPMAQSQYAPTPTTQTNRAANVLGLAALGGGVGSMIGGNLGGFSSTAIGAGLGALGGLLS